MKVYTMLYLFLCFGALVMVSCDGQGGGSGTRTVTADSPIAPYTFTTLDNGLDIIVKEVHSAPIVSVYLWCGTGSVNETPEQFGISHFYEHMFFKGTEKRGVGEIDRAVKSLGGYNNAFTGNEYTAYYVTLPSENFALAADVLVDAIRNSLFPPEEIEKELGVIKEEINRREDNPTNSLYEELFAAMFPDTPYAHPVLGTRESVSGITRDDFREYLHTFYVPNNMTAVVVGDVTSDETIAEFRKLTADWRPDPAVESKKASFEVPRLTGVREIALERDVNVTYVMMAFQTAGYGDERENATLDVLSSVLGEGRSSRLYRRVVEGEQIASAVEAYINPLTRTGLFMVLGVMNRENVPRFREVILEEIDCLGSELLPPDELAKVQTMLKADFQFANETDADIGQTLGHYRTLGRLDQATEYETSIDAVTADDALRYASETLDTASYTIGIIYPKQPDGEETR